MSKIIITTLLVISVCIEGREQKPLNIKPMPRFIDTSIIDWDDSMDNGFWVNVKDSRFSTKPMQEDTLRCIFLVSDTSSQSGFRSQRAYWIYGYILWFNKGEMEQSIMGYLDQNRSPLKKSLVVWFVKPVVQ